VVQAFAKKNGEHAVMASSGVRVASENGAAQTVTNGQAAANNKLTAQEIKHTVKAGETLWSISKEYGAAIDSVREMNHLNGNNVRLNQILTIIPEAHNQYIVRNGDTLASISREHKLSVSEIKAQNKLTSDVIFPKQVLTLGGNK
jgi:LysM repeat protein